MGPHISPSQRPPAPWVFLHSFSLSLPSPSPFSLTQSSSPLTIWPKYFRQAFLAFSLILHNSIIFLYVPSPCPFNVFSFCCWCSVYQSPFLPSLKYCIIQSYSSTFRLLVPSMSVANTPFINHAFLTSVLIFVQVQAWPPLPGVCQGGLGKVFLGEHQGKRIVLKQSTKESYLINGSIPHIIQTNIRIHTFVRTIKKICWYLLFIL